MSRPTLKSLLALMIAIAAALVTQPLRAGAIDTLVITEFDSTSLTATLNGTTSLTVTPNGVEIWLIDLTGVGAPSGTNSGNNWTEPDATGALGFVNNVVVDSTNFPNQLRVRSDFGPGFTGALTNNTQDTTDFTLNGSPLYVTFNDLGDVATAPDTGTTASLLGLSLTGLAFLRRKL